MKFNYAKKFFTLTFTWMMTAATLPSAWAAPVQVLIIRHAEKPAFGQELSPVGYQRAAALVGYFRSNPEVTRYGTPVEIYAMGQKAPGSSMRPIETVMPLARSLGLNLKTQYEKNEIQPLVEEILNNPSYDGKMVLICWEHNVIPQIAEAFGVTSAPTSWNGNVYDDVWEIDFSGNQASGFKIFKQTLGN